MTVLFIEYTTFFTSSLGNPGTANALLQCKKNDLFDRAIVLHRFSGDGETPIRIVGPVGEDLLSGAVTQ